MPTTRSALTLLTTGTATAVLALLATGHPAAAGSPASSAFGISATGAAPLPPQPSASTPDGHPVSSSAPIASADGSITATATVTASTGQAQATVTDLSLLFGQITAGQVTATCRDGAGTVTLTGGHTGDSPLPTAPQPGQTIALGDTGQVTLNTRTTNPDGTTTVTGLRATITTPAGPAETITVASATCAAPVTPPTSAPPTATPTHTPIRTPRSTPPPAPASQPPARTSPAAPSPAPAQPNRPAPTPVPVRTHVPVTG